MAEKGESRDPSTHRTPTQMKRMSRGYNARPENVQKRVESKRARKKLGLKKGDPRDAHHVTPQRSGGGNGKGNLRAVHKSVNRGWESEAKSKKLRGGSSKPKATRSGKKYQAPSARKKR